MRVFISYRRSDTGGRAGRLRDALAHHVGDDRVFHDVTTLVPGTDFDEQIDTTIARCDVVLVVIGGRWLDEADATGARRLDRPDDLVRHEVRTALTQGKRIVPVLVDGARLPTAAELPDDIAPLVRRQAVRLHDESWQRDVRELIHGLVRDPSGKEPRQLMEYVGAAILATAAVVALVTIGRDAVFGDRDGDDELPPCPEADDRWISVPSADPSSVDDTIEGNPARFEPRGARYLPDDEGALIVVSVALANVGEPDPDTDADDIYLSEGVLDALLVGGIETGDPVCAHVIGDATIEPGRTVVGEIGFDSEIDPAGASLVLATAGDRLVEFGTG